jgi:DNA-binding transcriptional ArsR family regulator
METRRDAFQAIADPTRREIIGLLVQKEQNLQTISEHFDMSRQAVSLHVKVLQECGLIMIRQEGRERWCRAQPAKLREVADWLAPYRQFWEAKLDALEQYLHHLQQHKKNHHGKRKR